MSKPITQSFIFAILNIADWTGHVEIGDEDKRWLAQVLFDALYPPKDHMRCDSCNELRPIVVRTSLGNICEDCLDLFIDEADEIREALES